MAHFHRPTICTTTIAALPDRCLFVAFNTRESTDPQGPHLYIHHCTSSRRTGCNVADPQSSAFRSPAVIYFPIGPLAISLKDVPLSVKIRQPQNRQVHLCRASDSSWRNYFCRGDRGPVIAVPETAMSLHTTAVTNLTRKT